MRNGIRLNVCSTYPIRRRRSAAASAEFIFATSAPSTRTLPLVGGVRPAIRCSTVLFPEPLGPIIAQNEPCGQTKERSLTARTAVSPLPKAFTTCRSSIME